MISDPETIKKLRSWLDLVWSKRSHSKSDWLSLEDMQKKILLFYKDGKLSPQDTILFLDETLGAFLRRGTICN